MKINELIKDFKIFKTNEEKQVLEAIASPTPLSSFNEREQVIISGLIRKSLIIKINNHGNTMVMRNETG
jgi:hypothetical protein